MKPEEKIKAAIKDILPAGASVTAVTRAASQSLLIEMQAHGRIVISRDNHRGTADQPDWSPLSMHVQMSLNSVMARTGMDSDAAAEFGALVTAGVTAMKTWNEVIQLQASLVFPVLDPSIASRSYKVLWNIIKKSLPLLTDEQTAIVISIVTGICPHCYEEDRGSCHCWNDE